MAQFFTDFSEYTTGQFPSDWTGRSTQDGTVEEDVSLTGGKGFYLDGTGSFSSNSWDEPGSLLTDFEVVTSLEIETTSTSEIDGWIVLRGTDQNNFFRIQLRNKNRLEFAKVISGSNTLGNFVTFNHSAGDIVHIRADVTQNGSDVDLRAKAWLNDDAEPVSWQVTETYTEISDGYTGIGRLHTGSTIYDIFGVGTGGDPAPMTEPGGSPNEVVGTITGGGTLNGITEAPDVPANEVTGQLSGGGSLDGVTEAPDIPANEVVGSLDGGGTLQGVAEAPDIVPNEVTGTLSGGGELVGVTEAPVVGDSEAIGTISGGGTLVGITEAPDILPNEVIGTLSGGGELVGVTARDAIVIGTLSGGGQLVGVIEGSSVIIKLELDSRIGQSLTTKSTISETLELNSRIRQTLNLTSRI